MTLALSIIALLSATLTVYGKLRENELLQFICKPLTMLAIILLIFSDPPTPLDFSQKAVLAGLIFSTIGDIFLIKQDSFFIHGLISFFVGHLCYIATFWTSPHWLSGLIYLLYLIFFLSILWKHLGKLKSPVFVYSTAIAVMSWLALSRVIENFNHQTGYAFLGSSLFIISDSLLAYNKFKSPLPYAHLWILLTYFLAQWLIALSV